MQDAQYMRTLRSASHSLSFTVEQVTMSIMGHVIFTGHDQLSHSLHVFTMNGRHLASTDISHRITGTVEMTFLGSDKNNEGSSFPLNDLMLTTFSNISVYFNLLKRTKHYTATANMSSI